MTLYKFQRFFSGVAGMSIISTVALIFAAFASGSIEQKDRFADYAAATGVLYAVSLVASGAFDD